MIPEQIVALRKELGLTQNDMAIEIGMNIRSWQDIESGKTAFRKIHQLAIERIALQIGVINEDIDVVPARVRKEALQLASLITGD